MVHGLETIIRMNDVAVVAAKKVRKRNRVTNEEKPQIEFRPKSTYYSARRSSEMIKIEDLDVNYFLQYRMPDDPDG